ncbi:DUF29 family protein [Pannus brasiliensis CCIBt3594]|uniref:DUF29 family protein n=1 Tax=Pannus brasiliensis CCIBt3594 TaxID=1427578 RepID=A0AAW9QDC1_9CHRO
MEELLELKELLVAGNISEALVLVEEMTEMSKDDKLNKIFSFAKILLLHLIKQAAENRTTRSWEISIANSVKEIQRVNKRRKTRGNYLTDAELRETLEDAYDLALRLSALEAFEGRYEVEEVAARIDRSTIINRSMTLIREDG